MVSPFLMVVSVVGVFAEKWRTWRESNPRPLASENAKNSTFLQVLFCMFGAKLTNQINRLYLS